MKMSSQNMLYGIVLATAVAIFVSDISLPKPLVIALNDNINRILLVVLVLLLLQCDNYMGMAVGVLLFVLVLKTNGIDASESFSNVDGSNLGNNILNVNNLATVAPANNAPANNAMANNTPANNAMANNAPANNSKEVVRAIQSDSPSLMGKEPYVGCRYDQQTSTMDQDRFGPPVSSCRAYSSKDIGSVKAAFYPMNPK